MNVDGAIYAAVWVAMWTGAAGFVLGLGVTWRTYRAPPRLAIGLLLAIVMLLSLAQFMEQSRVLLFRLSYDGFAPREHFAAIYSSTWYVVSSKLLMSMAIAAGACLQLALFCRRTEREIFLYTLGGAAGVLFWWFVVTSILEAVT